MVSFGAGMLVGIIYHLIHVRSPVPPLAAFIGLLGMLAGERVIPVGGRLLSVALRPIEKKPPPALRSR